MEGFSLFLFHNWLPVGVAAISFFAIGLLLAKQLWGRRSKRLSFAVEENLNLASQWSNLGRSQRDLFKKLWARWQADRDVWERRISETEKQLQTSRAEVVGLTERLSVAGGDPGQVLALAAAPPVLPSQEEEKTRLRLVELEEELAASRRQLEELTVALEDKEEAHREALASALQSATEEGIQQQEAAGRSTVAELEARIRDLEQDLIDTHDELHDVRSGYHKQLELVESLEARLISETLTPQEKEQMARAGNQVRQFSAMLAQRGREIVAFREQVHARQVVMSEDHAARVEAMEEALQLSQATLEEARETAARQLEEKQAALEEAIQSGLSALEEAQAVSARELEEAIQSGQVALQEVREISTRQLEEAEARIAELSENLQLSAAEMAELKAAHEVVLEEKNQEAVRLSQELQLRADEVREKTGEINGLHERLEARGREVAALEGRLSALEGEMEDKLSEMAHIDAKRERLRLELSDAHHEMYDVRSAFLQRLDEISALNSQVADLLVTEAERDRLREECAALEAGLQEAGQEIQLKVKALELAAADKEELEAIIEDRSSEVNSLSAEVTELRERTRKQKHHIAELEGELEALGTQSQTLSVELRDQREFYEEQHHRITDLEEALAVRYGEMNSLRERLDNEYKLARHHAARVEQLEAELERRGAAFVESDRRVATAEEALEEASARIAELTAKLEVADRGVTELQAEVQELSRDKVEKLRELKLATERIARLEAAAETRESQILQFEKQLKDGGQRIQGLDRQIDKLSTELIQAKQEQGLAMEAIARLEEELKASDNRTLQLSKVLDSKERELEKQLAELGELHLRLEERDGIISEREAKIRELEREVELRLADLAEAAQEHSSQLEDFERKKQVEIAVLQEQIEEHTGKVRQLTEQQERNLASMEKLRRKLDARNDQIRELQTEISSIVMQRASRDNEISLLKDKLRMLEQEFKLSLAAARQESANVKSIEASLLAHLVAEPEDVDGMALDDLATVEGGPQESAEDEPVVAGATAPTAEAGGDSPSVEAVDAGKGIGSLSNDLVAYFEEGSDELTPKEMAKVDAVAKAFRTSRRRLTVTVTGFSGSEGSILQSETLSARRADAVRERLLERGVRQGALAVTGSGVDRRFSDWRARRVEMILAPEAVAERVN